MKKKRNIKDIIKSKYIIIFLIISLIFNIYFMIKNKKEGNLENKIKNNYIVDQNIVFFGDSITNKYKLEEFFPNNYVINSGISGNEATDLIDRIYEDVYRYNPSKVFILIGINDLNHGVSKDELLDNIQKIVNKIKTNRKYSKIYIESIYPINRDLLNKNNYEFNEDINNEKIKEINKKIEDICKNNDITYINVFDELIDDEGNLKDIYSLEGLHLSDLGYFKVTSKIEKYVKEK